MKKWLTMLVVLATATGAFAGEGWETDFEKAKAAARAQGKYILIDFSGSDWCGWCIKLDKEVFSQQAFKDYARENLVLMLADFPRDTSKQSAELRKQNKKLSEEFGVNGFPTVFLLDSNGRKLAKTGYRDGGPEAYVEHLKGLVSKVEK